MQFPANLRPARPGDRAHPGPPTPRTQLDELARAVAAGTYSVPVDLLAGAVLKASLGRGARRD
jgi:hypothetical protein